MINPDVTAYVKGFKIATEIAKISAHLGKNIVFPNSFSLSPDDITANTELVIVDLDNKEENLLNFVSQIRSHYPDIIIVGFLTHVKKRFHSEAREAGCTWILPRTSFVMNLPSLIENKTVEID